MSPTRRARVRAFAKINLDLRVLGRRPDGYHELRTVFQTISLADTLELSFTAQSSSKIELRESVPIPGNLVVQAAERVLEALKRRGKVVLRLEKRVPMGAGLGGGSSDAAAVLLALPVLAGEELPLGRMIEIGSELGSDVPFFLLGGTALGIGRGSELYPLPDAPHGPGLLVTPGIHVSTAEAYRLVGARLTTRTPENKIISFQSQAWVPGGSGAKNDFESVVFRKHRVLAEWQRRLVRAGAVEARMTGSGSAIFGLFRTREDANRARAILGKERAVPISHVSRARYRSIWWKALAAHTDDNRIWPPRSRYVP